MAFIPLIWCFVSAPSTHPHSPALTRTQLQACFVSAPTNCAPLQAGNAIRAFIPLIWCFVSAPRTHPHSPAGGECHTRIHTVDLVLCKRAYQLRSPAGGECHTRIHTVDLVLCKRAPHSHEPTCRRGMPYAHSYR